MQTMSWFQKCAWCGMYHDGECPRVKAFEYYPDGRIKRVELFELNPSVTFDPPKIEKDQSNL